MNKHIISMFLYFGAAALLFGYAFTTNSICLYLGIACLAAAIIFPRPQKNRRDISLLHVLSDFYFDFMIGL